MALSRKHYNAIAFIFSRQTEELKKRIERTGYVDEPDKVIFDDEERRASERYGVYVLEKHRLCNMAWEMGEYFVRDNPNFDSDRFMKAAGCQ